MKELQAQLRSIEDVRDFVSTVSQFASDIDIVGGRYIIDAKSILGLFSLDLQKPILVQIHDDEEAPEIEKALAKFAVA